MTLRRTNSDDVDFLSLVEQLDEYLSDIDGEEHSFFAQFNGLDRIANTVVAYDGETPVGCGAFKPYSETAAEIKRMFVSHEFRGRNIGGLILAELESWAAEIGFSECILETGHRQQAAVIRGPHRGPRTHIGPGGSDTTGGDRGRGCEGQRGKSSDQCCG